jgi:hypothetical protein
LPTAQAFYDWDTFRQAFEVRIQCLNVYAYSIQRLERFDLLASQHALTTDMEDIEFVGLTNVKVVVRDRNVWVILNCHNPA